MTDRRYWIWLGFVLLAFGTGITLLPDARLERLTARVPDRASSGASAAGLLESGP